MPPCFFKAKSYAAPNEFTEANIDLETINQQCEIVFGIKVSKFPESSDFALLYATGFNTIYGITNKKQPEAGVKCIELANLNEFLLASTIEDKKALFLKHAQDYLPHFFDREKIEVKAYNSLITYAAQQFNLASESLLTTRNKLETKDEYIIRLKQIGRNVASLVRTAVDIKSALERQTEPDLTSIIQRLENLTPQINSSILAADVQHDTQYLLKNPKGRISMI